MNWAPVWSCAFSWSNTAHHQTKNSCLIKLAQMSYPHGSVAAIFPAFSKQRWDWVESARSCERASFPFSSSSAIKQHVLPDVFQESEKDAHVSRLKFNEPLCITDTLIKLLQQHAPAYSSNHKISYFTFMPRDSGCAAHCTYKTLSCLNISLNLGARRRGSWPLTGEGPGCPVSLRGLGECAERRAQLHREGNIPQGTTLLRGNYTRRGKK